MRLQIVQFEEHCTEGQRKTNQITILKRRVEQQRQEAKPGEPCHEFFERCRTEFSGKSHQRQKNGDIGFAVQRFEHDVIHAAEEFGQEQFQKEQSGLVRIHMKVPVCCKVGVIADIQTICRLQDKELILLRDNLVAVDPEKSCQRPDPEQTDLPGMVKVLFFIDPPDIGSHPVCLSKEEQSRCKKYQVQKVAEGAVMSQEDLFGPVRNEECRTTSRQQQEYDCNHKKQPADKPFIACLKRFHDSTSLSKFQLLYYREFSNVRKERPGRFSMGSAEKQRLRPPRPNRSP